MTAHSRRTKYGPNAERIPVVGSRVLYMSEVNDGVYSPAVVLRTRESTIPEVLERWPEDGSETLSGVGRPEDLTVELPDALHVDLVVHGLGGDYRRYTVPYSGDPEAGHWFWPEYE